MKTADEIASTVTGGQHLSWEERQKAGPAVHYAFGALMGSFYAGLAEFWPAVRAGFGTTFGNALFTGPDLKAIPVPKLGPSPDELPKTEEVSVGGSPRLRFYDRTGSTHSQSFAVKEFQTNLVGESALIDPGSLSSSLRTS
jgi:uncharacterized protein DUF1440